MARIVAVDERVVFYPRDQVREVLADVRRYGEWWPKPYVFRPLDDEPGAPPRVEVTNQALRWVATLVDQQADSLTLRYGPGAWSGEARWSLRPTTEGTAVVFRIDLHPTRWWLSALGRVVNLGQLHSRRMRHIFDALDARLAQFSTRAPRHA